VIGGEVPLRKGSSQKTISTNIREMRKAGHPENVSVAAAMRQAYGPTKKKKKSSPKGKSDWSDAR
jgi:hypothetical protein